MLDAVDFHQPDLVIQMGDLYDFYSWSRHPKSLNLTTPQQELEDGRGEAEAFWEAVKTAVPKARRIQLLGNHDTRVERLAANKAPELEAVLNALDVQQLWRFRGVETQSDYRNEITIENLDRGEYQVMFHHGHRGKLGDHMKYNQCSTAIGHTHKGGVVFQRLRDRVIWELNAGYIADQKSKALSYTQQSLSDSVAGYGLIDEKGPRFIPL